MKKISATKFLKFLSQRKISLNTDLFIKQSKTYIRDVSLDGVLNGNGYTIHNVQQQLFKNIGEKGVIKDLNFVNATGQLPHPTSLIG